MKIKIQYIYSNYHKFSHKQVCANTVDSDQTDMILVYTVCSDLCNKT